MKIWIKYFFKSFVWLILPLCLFGSFKSCSEYIEAGQQLTPYSVDVQGYYRSDGTYIRPHSRRPHGGVAHDAPYKRKRFYMSILFVVSSIGGIGSILAYTSMSNAEINRQQKIIEDAERVKRQIERKRYIDQILASINFDFSALCETPLQLKDKPPPYVAPHSIYGGGGPRKCKFCKKPIVQNTFYVSFIAVSKTHYVCMTCVKERDSIGRNQPQSMYSSEIKYVEAYQVLLNKFKSDFAHKVDSNHIIFNDEDLNKIFNQELKNTANKT
jgi:hypothetical protein